MNTGSPPWVNTSPHNNDAQEDTYNRFEDKEASEGGESHACPAPQPTPCCCRFITTSETQKYQLLFSCSHSFLSGWSDALAFANFRCFSNLMTGNLAVGAVAIAVQNLPQADDFDEQAVVGLDPNLAQLQPAYAYYSIVGTFILGAFTSTLVELKLRHRGKEPFWGMLILLAASDIGGCLAVTFARQLPSNIFILFFIFFSFSAGVQYEYISAKPYGLLTTLQTGNLQRSARGLARVVSLRPSQGNADKFETENFRILQTILAPICLTVGATSYGTILRYTQGSGEVLVISSVWIILVIKVCLHIWQHYKLNVPKDIHLKL